MNNIIYISSSEESFIKEKLQKLIDDKHNMIDKIFLIIDYGDMIPEFIPSIYIDNEEVKLEVIKYRNNYFVINDTYFLTNIKELLNKDDTSATSNFIDMILYNSYHTEISKKIINNLSYGKTKYGITNKDEYYIRYLLLKYLFKNLVLYHDSISNIFLIGDISIRLFGLFYYLTKYSYCTGEFNFINNSTVNVSNDTLYRGYPMVRLNEI